MAKKKEIKKSCICNNNNMDETWGYYAKWNKSEKENTIQSHIHVESKQNKAKTRLMGTETRLVVVRAWGVGVSGVAVERGQKVQILEFPCGTVG